MAALGGVPATWEICRAGAAAAAVAPPDQPELAAGGAFAKKITDNSVGAQADCGYCLPHAGSVGLTSSTSAGLGLTAGRALQPLLFCRAPQPLLALCAAKPRGPPAFA